jgi:hypothetical protein
MVMEKFIKWVNKKLLAPELLTVYLLIGLAYTSSIVGVILLLALAASVKRLVDLEYSKAWQEGYEFGVRPKPIYKVTKDLSEKENEESYW